jgi:hypothetical protein
VFFLTGTAGAKMLGVQYPDNVEAMPNNGLSSISLDEVIGRGFPVARDFPSDISRMDLEQIVGRGFISKLTPDEIGQIDAQGFLPSPEELIQMTQNLVKITIKGIKIVIDKSNFSQEELAAVVNDWEKFLAAI